MTDGDPRVVFLFTELDVLVFPSLTDAEGWMEAIDVAAGEYTAALTDTGQIIRMSTKNEEVILELTDETNLPRLKTLLRDHNDQIGQPGADVDPIAFANRSWQLEWETRWPKRPHWLDKLLHPHGPTQV